MLKHGRCRAALCATVLALAAQHALQAWCEPGPRRPRQWLRSGDPTAAGRRRVFEAAAAALLAEEAFAEVPVYTETDNLGEVWTTASVLKRRAKELQKLSNRKLRGSQAPLPRAFLTYLTRVLINYDRRSIKLWAQSAPDGAVPAEARRAQFAALAAAVDLGIIGAYGSDAQGLQSLAKALRGLCRSDVSAKRQVAFALSLLPSELQPVNVIEELVSDVTSNLDFVDIPSSNLDAAAAATDAALQRLPKQSLPRRLAALIPDGLALPELVENGTASYFRPSERALLAAAALSSLEVNLDGGEGFGVGSLAGAELPASDRPASLDPLFGPLGRSPVARERGLDASQYLRLAVSGAVCSAVVRAVLQPLEVVKTTQQLSTPSASEMKKGEEGDFQSTAKKLLKEGGMKALYKGTDATILATGVMGFTSFGLNELFRRTLERMSGDATGEPGALLVLGASIAAVFVSGIIAAPFETLRVRVMAPTEGRSWGELAAEAVSKGFSELWAGLGPFWAREIPFSACKFLVFDLASRALFSLFPAAADAASLEISALAGAIAGLASAVVSNPADVIITQTSASGDAGLGSTATLNLWKGLGARSVYFAAAICAQFLLYDSVKELLGVGSGDLQLVLDVFGISQKAESLLG